MATSGVKLFGSRHSPFVNRVVMALEMKSVDFELVDMNPYEKSELLIKINPVHKKTPVLVHGDKPICESQIIVQYIDDAWNHGPSILPHDPYDRAMARFWAAFVDDKWLPAFSKLEKASGDEARAALIGEIFEGAVLLEEAFVKCRKGKAYFSGDNIGYIDVVLGSFLGWIKLIESEIGMNIFDETRTPGLARWAQRFSSDDAAKAVLPEHHKLKDFYTMVLQT